MNGVPERIGIAGDGQGNIAWATRAGGAGGRRGAAAGTYSAAAGTSLREVVLAVRRRWLRLQGRPISNILPSLASR
jgi:hypothetical protein